MFYSFVRFFFPSIKDEEIKKFCLLGLIFTFLIGGYWLMRLLKDTLFFKIAFPESVGWPAQQGKNFQPIAKTISPFVVVGSILIYSKLVDIFKKHQLFYVIGSFYAVMYSLITALLFLRASFGDEALGKTVLAAMGWVSYFTIESFGSLMPALFWSFVISITDTESAKIGFPLAIAGAQIGSVSGSALSIFSAQLGGIRWLFGIGMLLVVIMMLLVRYFMAVMPPNQLVGDVKAAEEDKKEEQEKKGAFRGFAEGLTLMFSHRYLIGVMICSTVYEIIGTIIDFQMKAQADIVPQFAGELGFSRFMGYFGVSANGLAMVMSLLGTSYLMKRYGLRICLLIYPVSLGTAVMGLYLFSQYGAPTAPQLLWFTFGVMMITKGLSYAVNNPSKDMMYIPTSKSVKFKVKGWSDMFGQRLAKLGGAQVTNALKANMAALVSYGALLSLGIVGVWIMVALYVGSRNKKMLEEGIIIH